jgi:hypothetical protein
MRAHDVLVRPHSSASRQDTVCFRDSDRLALDPVNVPSAVCPERGPVNEASHWLLPHVYITLTDNGAVFLDLKRDRYVGLSMEDTTALSRILAGLQHERLGTSFQSSPSHAATVAEECVTHGLITCEPGAGKKFEPLEMTLKGMMHSLGHDTHTRRQIRLADFYTFAAACISAAVSLRFIPFERVVGRVVQRKRRNVASARAFESGRVSELVTIFRVMRSFTFIARNHCLFHALALINFLSSYGYYPTWVIGVNTRPWGAHSWVQHEHYVLDDTPEDIRYYTPILSS